MIAAGILKGTAIGLMFGLPAGAVGAMTAQRTWNYGWRAGLLTGLGSSAADCFYACVGVFGITFISDFMLKYQTVINCAGGLLILAMGAGLFRKKKKVESGQLPPSGKAGMFLTSFGVGITNPAAILTFLFAFSLFGLAGGTGPGEGAGVVAGVFIGTYIWWGTLTGLVIFLKKRAKKLRQDIVNRIFGVVLILLGGGILLADLIQLCS